MAARCAVVAVAAMLWGLAGPGAVAPALADGPVMTNKVGPAGRPQQPAAEPVPAPASTIVVSPVTPVAKSVKVHAKILDECRIQSLLPQRLADRRDDVVLGEGRAGSRLELTIIDVRAPSGGVFSGPKWVTVEGRLRRGNQVIGTFVAKEASMASARACGMLDKVVSALAAEIATWLDRPKKGSFLGSAR